MRCVRCSPGRSAFPLIGLLLLLPGFSCGRAGNQKPVFPVNGQVLLDGQPVANALVVFHPVEQTGPDGARPFAETDRDGRFALGGSAAGDGAPAGEYQVTVVARSGENEQEAREVKEDSPRKGKLTRLPTLYANPQTSGLRVRVNEGRNELDPFRLTLSQRGPIK